MYLEANNQAYNISRSIILQGWSSYRPISIESYERTWKTIVPN